MEPKSHWEKVYSTKGTTEVSWFQGHARLSLKIIRDAGAATTSSMIDVVGRPLALAFVSSAFAIGPATAADAARDAATSFYRSYAKLRAIGKLTGIPDAAQLATLAPFLTPELRRLMAAAKKEQVRCAKVFPEDKPPWIEGDIFSSSFEGFTSFRAGPSKGAGKGRSVMVRFRYAERRGAGVEWQDELALRNEAGRWRVDDVFYRANFEFSSGFGTNLKDSLRRIPAC